MNDKALKLTWRMVLATIAGRRERTWELYEKYVRERYLYVTVREIIEAKERTA